MNDNQSERSRGRRRGGRRRSNDRGDRAEARSAPAQQQPTSLWEKIVSFFTGKKKTAPDLRPARKYPAYEPRSQSGGQSETREAREPRESRAPRESRKPEAVEVTSTKLYVGNLSFDASESDLFELFNGVGKVQNAEVVTHKETERSKGFGFVHMTTVDEAKRAVVELHDKDFMGRKLVVSGAKTPADRSSAPSEPGESAESAS